MDMRAIAAIAATMILATSTPAAESAATKQAAKPALTIHHIEGRRSERIGWLCEELGILYTLECRKIETRPAYQGELKAARPDGLVGSPLAQPKAK